MKLALRNSEWDPASCPYMGLFGAWGKDYNFAGGADGQQTGFNNSGLCANPPGSAADPTSP